MDKKIIKEQGFEVRTNIVYQDNQSAMRLEKNGNNIAGNRTRHFDIKVIYIKDLINQDMVEVKFYSTDNMTANYFFITLLGTKFKKMKDLLMNLSNKGLPLNSSSVLENNKFSNQ